MSAWIATIAILIGPGIPLALLIWRRVPALRSPALILAAVPLVSVATLFTLILVSPVDHIGRSFGIVVLVVALLASVAVVRLVPHQSPESRPSLDRWSVIGIGAIALAALVGGTVWVSGMPGLNQPSPNYDSAAHGFMVARIMETGTNSPDRVVISGPEDVAGAAGYYPLGIHSAAAVATALSGASITTVLNVFVIFFAAFALPLSAYALMRVLVPNLRFAAPIAAVASVSAEAFPYKPIGWGGLGTIIGNVAALALAALVISVVRHAPRSWVAAGFAAVAAVGLFHIHNSEIVVAGLLIGLVLLIDLPTRDDGGAIRFDPRVLLDAWSGLWRIGVISALLLAPVLPSVIRGGSERSSFDDTPLSDPLVSLGNILFMQAGASRQGALLLVAIGGMGVLVRRRKYALPAMFVLIVLAAYSTATSNNPVSSALTFPWWRQPERMVYVVSMIATLCFAVAVASVVGPIERSRRTAAGFRWAAIGAVIGLAGLAVLVPGAQAGRTMVYRSYEYYSPITDASRAGFAVAAEVAGNDGTVLTDFNRDGSLWMYAMSRAQPLYTLQLTDTTADKTWDERMSLISNVGLIGIDAGYDALIEKYKVRALYFDENTYWESHHGMSRSALRELAGLHEVFTEGSVSVFAVVRTVNS